MTISTLGILVHVTPTLVGNACRHYVRFLLGCGWCAPRESANEFLYDQLFHLISKLTIYLTHHTAEDVQKLTDQLVPVPPWCYCLLYTSPSPRDRTRSRMPSSA